MSIDSLLSGVFPVGVRVPRSRQGTVVVEAEGGVFRRICMAFDGLIVGFGLSRVLSELNLTSTFTTYGILSIVVLVNAYLLYRFFRDRAAPA